MWTYGVDWFGEVSGDEGLVVAGLVQLPVVAVELYYFEWLEKAVGSQTAGTNIKKEVKTNPKIDHYSWLVLKENFDSRNTQFWHK